ncbi:hypothetical protein GQ53DRAFT_429808 [Thozetella sp. PMI_491]|nr:hypothetical protein GQ53DRAFT_429808 [Thozetella sp. PMI_491]
MLSPVAKPSQNRPAQTPTSGVSADAGTHVSPDLQGEVALDGALRSHAVALNGGGGGQSGGMAATSTAEAMMDQAICMLGRIVRAVARVYSLRIREQRNVFRAARLDARYLVTGALGRYIYSTQTLADVSHRSPAALGFAVFPTRFSNNEASVVVLHSLPSCLDDSALLCRICYFTWRGLRRGNYEAHTGQSGNILASPFAKLPGAELFGLDRAR